MDDLYEYQVINVSLEPSPDPHGIRKATIESAANRWTKQGWRTVAAMPSRGPGYADAILIERKRFPLAIEVKDDEGKSVYYRLEDVRFIYLKEDQHG